MPAVGMPADPLGALAPIVARKQAEAAHLRCAAATLWARAEAMGPARGFARAVTGGRVIAEMKRRSPSGGDLRLDLDPAAVALQYAAAGVAALSVLTDWPDFGGSLDDLVAARGAVKLPVLRKDFTVDPVQIAEARVAGADAVLLIAAVLGAPGLEECLEAAARCHLDALVEVHDAAEARLAVESGATLIGINNRDLRTLQCDQATFARVRRHIPPGCVVVAESGIRSPEEATRLMAAGADAVLVGETLMRAPDPGRAAREMSNAARLGYNERVGGG